MQNEDHSFEAVFVLAS
uniref:Uncharacterized protein n=1 Tax=Arundo donax TaxID=35708 RepID=A0A0A9GT30_ARUDO